jgi:peptidoglycan/LPS O-acetylase OafA/YrhL
MASGEASATIGKLVPLEALRGCAAVLVVLSHFTLAFMPQYIGLTPDVDLERDMIGSPVFVFLNGTAMVVIFFVLSGYVLAQRGLRAAAPRALLDAAIKRWFRLTPLILVSTLISYGLFRTGCYAFEDAARFSHSDWLVHFSYGGFAQHDRPSLPFALWQGLWGVLLAGDSSLDSSLWTMQIEFIGSFIVFGLALLLRPKYRRLLAVILVGLSPVLIVWRPWYFPFILGLAACLAPLRGRELPAWLAIGLTIVALYLAGFLVRYGAPGPNGAYAWISRITPAGLPDPRLSQIVVVCGAGALLLLIVFATENAVSRSFSPRVARILGAASFPLYVAHVLIIDSFSSRAYAALGGTWRGLIAAAAALIAALVPLVWVLSIFDQWWLGVLRRWRIVGPPVLVPHGKPVIALDAPRL